MLTSSVPNKTCITLLHRTLRVYILRQINKSDILTFYEQIFYYYKYVIRYLSKSIYIQKLCNDLALSIKNTEIVNETFETLFQTFIKAKI